MSNKEFEDCVKNGGKLKTKNIKGNRYINICYDKEGNSYASRVMVRETDSDQISDKENGKVSKEALLELQAHYRKNYHHN